MACSARHGYRPGTASVAVIVNTIEVALVSPSLLAAVP
jgi:hypothetical protein